METLSKLKQLIFKNESDLKLIPLNFSKNDDYNSFEMTKEYFLDIFETRLEINNDMNIIIKGLATTIENIKSSSETNIISHSINNGDILIYTNRDVTKY
jgi:hypothetical protein